MASHPSPRPAGSVTAPGTRGFNAGEAISYGWQKFGENTWPMLLVTFLLFLVAVPGNYAARTATDTDLDFSPTGAVATIITGVLVLVIGAVLVRGALDITEGYPFDIVLAFKMLNLVNVLATSLVISVVTVLGLALLIIPGVLIAVLSLFAIYFVADSDTSNAIDSISSGLYMINDNVGDAIVLILLSVAAFIVGFVALCFGAFVALPVLAIVWAYSFKVFRGKPVAA